MRSARHATIALMVCLILCGASKMPLVAMGDEPDPRRPAAITTEQVPAIPSAITARLNQYQNTRAAAFRGWSPDGQGLLISTRFGNAPQLHRVYTPGGRREQVTFYDEPVSGQFLLGATDGAILLTMDSGGNENTQVLLLDRQRSNTTLLTDGKSRNSLEAIRRDNGHLLISSNRRNGRDMDLYLTDPRQPGADRLVMQVDRETWMVADWSPDGKTALVIRLVSINETYPALLDLATGTKTDLPKPNNETAAFGPGSFAADGKSILIGSDAGGEFRRLARFDLATRQYEWLSSDIPWDVAEIAVEHHKGDVAFAVNEDGASGLYLLPGGRGPRQRLELPLGIVAGLDFSPDGNELGFSLARPDAPADVYSLRLRDQQLTRWTYSEVGGLDPSKFVTPSRIQYPSFDGRKIPAYYFRPRDASADKKVPVVINIHGGPESQYRPLFSGVTQYYCNELGLAVICPNVRGSAGYGKTYLKLDNGMLREDAVKDIGALLDWIAQQPELDASRVAVEGGSYGGFMVLASLTHFPKRIRAGVDSVGIANFLTFLERTAGYRVDLRRAEYGDERDPAMHKFLEQISPLNHADKISSALLVVHGKNDPRVPFFEAQQIAAKVRGNGRPVWTVYADNEGHGFSKKDNNDYLRGVMALFYQTHLKQ